jgi:serine/threonine protein kinase
MGRASQSKSSVGFTMKRETPSNVKAIHPNDRSNLMHGMISSVLALHDKGIVDGDIKPANMLLCSDGKIRLCDFAEARLRSEDPADWEGMTTTNYVSPRRCQNNLNWPDDSDSAPVVEDDLYALGLSIWELRSGKMPFDGVYADDIREMVKSGQTVDVTRVWVEAVRGVICDYLRCAGARI